MFTTDLKRKDDDYVDDDDYNTQQRNPYDNLRLNVVLNDSKCFGDKELSIYKCSQVIIKLLWLLQHGEKLNSEEATDLFFRTTKLFQSNDIYLRRLTYLLLKELNSVESENALIVVSCLNKDMTSRVDMFRSNSIRVLGNIIDGHMLSQLERFFKQNLLDNNSDIVVSVLTLAHKLYKQPSGCEVIKRWVTEITEQLHHKNNMVNYHALSLLLKIRSNDKLAINKLITQLGKATQPNSTNNMQQLLCIRIVYSLLKNSNNNINKATYDDYITIITNGLKSKYQLVQYEACRILSDLPNINTTDLIPAVSVLQDMLSSVIPTHRFASLRILNTLVTKYSSLVVTCITQLEHLIHDSNRSIATLAVTILLKSGNEYNIEKLMKQITTFLTEANDEYKVILVVAIENFCYKFPTKIILLVNFLASVLREEGGYNYKKQIVTSMKNIMTKHSDIATDIVLDHFCEFIEDCEYIELSIDILYTLSDKGIHTSNPNKYIRFIYNRCILESSAVRAAAVNTLFQFGLHCNQLTDNIIELLNRILLTDNDDDVRECVRYNLNILNNNKLKTTTLQLEQQQLPNLTILEKSIDYYIKQNNHNTLFTLDKHLLNPSDITEKDEVIDNNNIQQNTQHIESDYTLPTSQSQANNNLNDNLVNNDITEYTEQLHKITELQQCGDIYKSSNMVDLTESESEYLVQCIKHITTQNYVIFQFIVHNTMDKIQLNNVAVEMECDNDEWSNGFEINETQIEPNNKGICYVVYNRPSNQYNSNTIHCRLIFNTVEIVDGESMGNGTPDEYPLDDIEVYENDYIREYQQRISLIEFKQLWGDDTQKQERNEVEKRYGLALEPLQDIVNAVLDAIGCAAVEESGHVNDNAKSHALYAVGEFYPNIKVCVRAQFVVADTNTRLRLVVRSDDLNVSTLVANASAFR